jgi:hypothetical protein
LATPKNTSMPTPICPAVARTCGRTVTASAIAARPTPAVAKSISQP